MERRNMDKDKFNKAIPLFVNLKKAIIELV